MERVLIYIFKILGILVLSLMLWATIIGRPTLASDGTTAANYVDQGSYFEEFVYGDRDSGFKWLTGLTWLQSTGCNGLQTELVTQDQWRALETSATSSKFATTIN